MNKLKQLEQFTQDVDLILGQSSSGESEQWTEANRGDTETYRGDTETYRGEMEIVRALAKADFSTESRVKQTLKSKLLNTHLGKKEQPTNMSLWQRSFVRLAFVALAVLLILVVSPLGSSLAQTFIQTVQSWQVGENTRAVSVDGDFEAVPGENGETIVQPAPELTNDEQESDPALETGRIQERDITLDEAVSLDRAQELVKFTLRQPTFMADGYEFQGVTVIHSGQASLDYVNSSGGRLIGLLQTAVGGEDGEVQVTFSSDTDVEEVEVDGREALWTQAGDEGMLVWEADNVNYQLVGVSDLEVALRIAESIE